MRVTTVLISVLVQYICYINGQLTQFPESFKFGSASAAYQVEGGWNADGKGPSIWDDMTHNFPEKIADRSNGDVAADSYHLYKEDVQMLKNSSMQFYRFSIAWSRVMPDGDYSSINEAGLLYYDRLIGELLENGIEPVVTMYHWDLPSKLQDLGGFLNPKIVDYFVAYADVLFKRYATRVKIWTTFNEPQIICENGYATAERAPLVNLPGIGGYLCAHHIILAHAKAYDLYQKNYKEALGKIGIVISCGFKMPKDPSNPADVDAANRVLQFNCGHYTHPIFSKTGGYPQVMIDMIGEKSKKEGRAWSRLPEFDETTKNFVRGKGDFIGVNYYTSHYVEPRRMNGNEAVGFWSDHETQTTVNASWPVAKSSWLRSYPQGLRGMLNWIKNEYENVETIVTENGWSDDGQLEDNERVEYLTGHIQATLDAINDGCNVSGYTVWSIMDNFEWNGGYTERFGIYYVDFLSEDKQRVEKKSVEFLRNTITNRRLPAQ